MKGQKLDTATKELIGEVEKKLQIALTLSIFFPVLMATYFVVAGGTTQQEHQAFIYFPMVGFYILSYVVFELLKLMPPIKFCLRVLNWALLLGIACFALPTLLTIVAEGPLNFGNWFSYHINLWGFVASLTGISALPFAILLFMCASLILGFFAQVFHEAASKKIF